MTLRDFEEYLPDAGICLALIGAWNDKQVLRGT